MTTLFHSLVRLDRSVKLALQVTVDVILIFLCFALAMALRLESVAFLANPDLWLVLAPVTAVTVATFHRLGLYRAVIRYITGQVLRVILAGTFLSALTLFIVSQYMAAPVPRSVPGIFALLLFFAAGGLRFLIRDLFRHPARRNRKPVIVYGAGESGRQLASALLDGPDYEPVAYLDDDPDLQNTIVAGKRVYPPTSAPELAEREAAQAILLAMPVVTRARRREIVAALEPLGVEIKTIPGMADIVTGKATFSDLRDVTPEDLLGREPVPPRAALMGRNITGKVVLVSGAGGSIGSELCRQIVAHAPAALVLFELSEYALYNIHQKLREKLDRTGSDLQLFPVLGSVQDASLVRATLRGFGVQTIYHAAAYKHVVMVEENTVEGIRNNVFGTRVIAETAAETGVENFILVSTDKAVRPANFMGASKRMAELVCQALAAEQSGTTFSMVRFGNVLGSSGSVIPRFRAQIARGGPVTVTHRDITRFFMTIPEAAQLVVQAGAMAKGGDVFVLDMGDPVRILDLALTMVRLHGLKPYVLDDGEQPEPLRGDIPVQIVGLGKGEKLYEELLLGNNPRGTDHPRIMRANEVSLAHADLNHLLDRLSHACERFDIPTIRQIFLDAPLAFQPASDSVHDLLWNAAPAAAIPGRKHGLEVIHGDR